MTHVLFVCTGNIFRSLTAEYALRSVLAEPRRVHVSSAGTRHAPELSVRQDVKEYLLGKGLDVSAHQRRTVSTALLEQSDAIIAMSTDHQQTLREQYCVESVLFSQACGGVAEALPDIDDLFAMDQHFSTAAVQHIYATIDRILEMVPALADNLQSGWSGNVEASDG